MKHLVTAAIFAGSLLACAAPAILGHGTAQPQSGSPTADDPTWGGENLGARISDDAGPDASR